MTRHLTRLRLWAALSAGFALAAFGAEDLTRITLPVTEVKAVADKPVRTYPGRVVPVAQVNVIPQVSGEILEVAFENGSEVKKGLIQDSFSPVVRRKLAAYGIETISIAYSGDGVDNVADAISEARNTGADMILCTGGMSVDPDDNTPGGIKQSGARIVTYGAPVLPGAMFLLGYFEDGTPICGLPGCVMYAGATVFDLVLPRLAAGVRVERKDLIALGEGGLCLGCGTCTWPNCGFGH